MNIFRLEVLLENLIVFVQLKICDQDVKNS